MNEAQLPAPAERVVRVIKANEAKSETQFKSADNLGSKARTLQSEATTLRAAETDLKSQIKSAEDIQATRGLLRKLEAGITGKAKSERSKSKTLKKELQDKITSAEIAEKQKTESESEAEKATKVGVHAGTVAEANRKNVSADSGRRSGEAPKKLSEEERVARKKQAATEFQKLDTEGQKAIKEEKRDVDWQERVVPIETTKTGREALERQSVISDTLKFYDSEDVGEYKFNKYDAEPKYLMPLPLINKLKQIIKADEKGYYRGADDKTLNKVLIGITPLYEQIVRISEEKGVPMNENLIVKAFTEGLNITKEINNHDTWEFVRKKQGGAVSAADIGYYQTAAASMEKFFGNKKNIVGEARLPYIIAYAAGEMVNNAPAHVVLDLRNLISEVIPVKRSSGETSPLGFGYSIDHNTFRKMATSDSGVVDAFTQANEIASKIFDTLREKRRFDMERKFASGLGDGPPDFSRMTPTLRNQELS